MMFLLSIDPTRQFPSPEKITTKVSLPIQRLMSLHCHKLLASGENLSTVKVAKICLKIAIQFDIKVKPTDRKGSKTVDDFLHFASDNEAEFGHLLKAKVREAEREQSKNCFWPTDAWISRFMTRWNLQFKTKSRTFYSKEGLLCQLVPSLEQTFALREIFDIPPGEGRILNVNESMTFRFDQESKSWQY